MRRKVGEVASQFNPSKYEGVKPIAKVYGDVRGSGDNFIQVSKSLIPQMTPSQYLKQLYEQKAPFLDLRNPSDFSMCHLKQSVNIDYHDVVTGAIKPILPSNQTATIVVIASSYRGQNAVHAMHKMGYVNTLLASFEDVDGVGEKDFLTSTV